MRKRARAVWLRVLDIRGSVSLLSHSRPHTPDVSLYVLVLRRCRVDSFRYTKLPFTFVPCS